MDTEVDVRRVRRFMWGFRAVLYGGAALAAALLLTGGGDEGSLADELHGETSANRPIMFVLEGDRPDIVQTYLAATCPDDSEWKVRWWARAGRTARFDLRDGTLRITDDVDRRYDDGFRGRRTFELHADFERKSARLDPVL